MAAVESGYLKSQLVSSHAERRARIESGEEKVVGVNCYETTEPSPLTADLDTAIMTVDPAERGPGGGRRCTTGGSARDEQRAHNALSELRVGRRGHRAT